MTPPSRTPPHPPRHWSRYVAIGDSFSEGMSDPDPGTPGAYRGWADRLAERLGEHARGTGSELGYANLAVRGRLLADIVGPQLEAALTLQPDLVSIVGGGNDILRPTADIDALAGELEQAVARIRATGADVLMATPADPWKAPLVRAVRGRTATYAAAIWGIAQRQGAFMLDQWTQPFLRDWQMWSEDRIHLSPEGHRRVAAAAAWTLGLPTDEADWRGAVPPAPVLRRRDAAAADARWARDHVGPWVQRRLRGQSSGDALTAKRPSVTPLAPPPLPPRST
ncbi:SGNH/GDSL hydrolase family protein [Dermatophilaceae bacterium Soc4.6]